MSYSTQLTKPAAQTLARRDDTQAGPTLVPAVDVYENSEGITLYADLPGVTKDRLDVKVHDGHLAIEAQAVVPVSEGLRVQHLEVPEPRFARTFTLNPELDTTRVEAELRDGVLKLTIPRREQARPRRIEIKAG